MKIPYLYKIEKNIRDKTRRRIVHKTMNYIPLKMVDLSTKPVDPWAFIRAKNEIITIDACLKSILPAITKGVIGYNESDDGTEEYILEFCKQNPGFIPFKYPHYVYPANDLEYKKNLPYENRLDGLYNTVLEQIPENEWIIKIDCDHIYDAEKLKKIFHIPKNEKQCVILSRLNIHYQAGQLFVQKKNSLFDVGDHWLICNNNLKFVFKMGHTPELDNFFAAFESLVFERETIFTDCTNWHFPGLKTFRQVDIFQKNMSSSYVPFKNIKKVLDKYDIKKITPDMLDEKRILNECKKFNFLKNKILP